MARVAPVVPDESALLCEGCGYILTGLPLESNCPECGKAIGESLPSVRTPPPWEQNERSTIKCFYVTTIELIFHPSRFYRIMRTRSGIMASRKFSRFHRCIASVLFGLCAFAQSLWLYRGINMFQVMRVLFRDPNVTLILLIILLSWFPLIYFVLTVITGIAARLSAWEAAYRGMRLPHQVVVRGLHYHSAHYLPVALLAFLTVFGYQILLATHVLTELSAPRYLYILCAEVILSAGYLFSTYWKGMRNMMFANS